MLKSLRKKRLAKIIWTILAIIIVPAFVLWGSSSLIRSKEESGYVGKIFGRNITTLEFQDAINATKNQLLIEYIDSPEELQKINLQYLAWQRLVLLAQAKKQKIKAGDEEVAEVIESYPFFRKKGRFDAGIYERILQYEFNTQARIFEEQIRQNLLIMKLYRQVTKDITASEEEVKKEYRKLNEELSIYYLAALFDEFGKNINPSEEEVKNYFNNNPLQFKQPLSFNLEYIVLEPQEADKKAIEDTVKEIVALINKKEEFAKIARDFNLQLKETGLFGQSDSIPGIGWSPQILDLLAKAEITQFLPPLVIDKNYYILRLKEKKDPYLPEFELIKEKVKDALAKESAKKSAKGAIDECLRNLKEKYQSNPEGADFDKIAAKFKLKSGSTDLFKYGSYIEGIGASDIFFLEAQGLGEAQFSEIISGPSGFYIIKLKSKTPVDEEKFIEEKEGFRDKLLTQKKQEYFNSFLQDLQGRAQ